MSRRRTASSGRTRRPWPNSRSAGMPPGWRPVRNCHSRVSAWSSAWWGEQQHVASAEQGPPRLIAAAAGVGFQIADSGYRQLTLLEGRAELRGQGSAVPRPFGAVPMQAMVQVNGADVRQASHGVQQHRRIETAAGGHPQPALPSALSVRRAFSPRQQVSRRGDGCFDGAGSFHVAGQVDSLGGRRGIVVHAHSGVAETIA